jgi:putative ABC transport system permease protein
MSLHLLLKSLLRRKVITVLLLVQLAMTLALLANSLLLANQTRHKLNEPTGLDLQHTLEVQLKPTTPKLRNYPQLGDLLERQMAAVRNLPGVLSVSYTNQGPVRQGGTNGNLYDANDEDRTNIPTIPYYFVSPDFFETLSLKLIEGELPQKQLGVDENAPTPMVLTRSLAAKLFPGKSAVGMQTNRAPVAAVVEDFFGQSSGTNEVYNAIQVAPLFSVDWGYTLLVKTGDNSTEQVRQQLPDLLRKVDANIEIFYVRSLEEQHHRLYRNEFGLATLLSVLSGLMLLVAMVSSYSNAHFHALKQRQEIGIKRALGASKQLILLELLSENWLTTLLGAVLGAVVGVLLNHALATVISLEALNWWLPLLCSLVLLVCVTFATWYPARIATAVSPATATKTL